MALEAPLARSEWERCWYRCVSDSKATQSDAKKVPLTALSLSGRQVAYLLFSEKLEALCSALTASQCERWNWALDHRGHSSEMLPLYLVQMTCLWSGEPRVTRKDSCFNLRL